MTFQSTTRFQFGNYTSLSYSHNTIKIPTISSHMWINSASQPQPGGETLASTQSWISGRTTQSWISGRTVGSAHACEALNTRLPSVGAISGLRTEGHSGGLARYYTLTLNIITYPTASTDSSKYLLCARHLPELQDKY